MSGRERWVFMGRSNQNLVWRHIEASPDFSSVSYYSVSSRWFWRNPAPRDAQQ